MFDRPTCRLAATLLTALLFLAGADGSTAAGAKSTANHDDKPKVEVAVSSWWIAGPLDHQMPALAGAEPDGDFGYPQLLAEPTVPISKLRPSDGGKVSGLADSVTWRSAKGRAVKLDPSPETARSAWLATRIQTHRFVTATLKVNSGQRFKVFVDGVEVAEQAELGEKADEPVEASLELESGSHLVLIKALAEPGADAWAVDVGLEVAAGLESAVSAGRSSTRPLTLEDMLDVARYSNLKLSPDGRWLAMAGGQPSVPADHSEQWIDIVDVESGEIVRSLRGGESNFGWLAEQDEPTIFFSLSSKINEEASDVYRSKLLSGDRQKVAEQVEHLQSVTALPDGSGWILEISEPSKADERGVKRFRDLPDRWAGWRDASYFVHLDETGKRRRLTVGGQSTGLQDIRFDGGAMVVSRVRYGTTERPYSETELFEIDLGSLKERSLATLKWFGNAAYSPDGKTLLITGSPALFGELGNVSEPHEFANEYDTQAYLMSIEDPAAVRAVSRDFDPAILSANWSRDDGLIYFEAQDRTWSRIYQFDPAGDATFVELPAATDTLSSPTVAGDRLAYVGSSPNRPYAVFVQNTRADAQAQVLADPSAERLQDVEFGEVKPWTFTSAAGDEILGRVYYPPGFDPARKYPLLVYYYAGTVPVDRTFGGRYPKELWAANDYVVYVPQPSGANGFGQEFSARHVNAWGRQTADEIIEGTQKLLAESNFLDADRVGCLGASYGGFMTMYLQTRTDIFSAAISHAGISNLASYWGKGWWGYLYSAAASAESMPWNNPELYVGQSPLYSADKIQTPLLLLHGDADTNVPSVESHQMYTALRLLGKEVELIEIAGENHTILTYPKRKLWSRTIIAWFDRWLKDQPEAWQFLWGDEREPKG